MSHAAWVEDEVRRLFLEEKLSYRLVGQRLRLTIGQVASICRKHGWKRLAEKKVAAPPVVKVKAAKVSAQAAKRIQIKADRRANGNGAAVINIRKRKSSGPKELPTVIEKLPEQGIELIELEWNQCRWPIGETASGKHLFCGEWAIGNGPYCEHHLGASVERVRSEPNPRFWRIR